jgi:hypothetical protein
MGKVRVTGRIGLLPISYCIRYQHDRCSLLTEHFAITGRSETENLTLAGYTIYSRGREASPALREQLVG